MKTTKMSLANIQGKLSRTELKKIMAGSGGTPNTCGGSRDTCDPAVWYGNGGCCTQYTCLLDPFKSGYGIHIWSCF